MIARHAVVRVPRYARRQRAECVVPEPGLGVDCGRPFRTRGGQTLGEYQAKPAVFSKEGNFARAQAHWPTDAAAPGAHHVIAIVYDNDGKELTRIAPRLVSVNMQPGY